MFAAGSDANVYEYLASQIPALADRLGLSAADLQDLYRVFMRSYRVCAARIEEDSDKGIVDAIVESRDLIEHLARLLMNADSTLFGAENFARALAFREQGGNVLIVQNHTSGADILATHALLSKDFPGVPAQFIWMAGHVVTKFLLPMLLAAGATRVQIFSVKYKSMAEGQDAEWLARLRHKSGIEDDRIIQQLAQAIQMDQATIKGQMMVRFTDTMMTVDTSGEDWGAENVETAISLLD